MTQITLDNSERFCVFRSGDCWYGIPALAVRSVVPRPKMTCLPYSDPILTGLCHLQNEFIPVISLQALTQIQYERSADAEQQLLIMLSPQGSWGLLIDQAVTLAALETSISTFSNRQDKWSRVTIGSASFQNQVLQILDLSAMYHYVASLLDMFWQCAEQTERQLICH